MSRCHRDRPSPARRSSRGGGALPPPLRPGPRPRPRVLPLAEVRPGMEGVGRTVFEGATIDELPVRILGVLENAIGPGHSLVLARLEGGPLAKTGVIAGMSGSPVSSTASCSARSPTASRSRKETIAGHHADRRDDRRHATRTRRARPRARFAALRTAALAGAARPRRASRRRSRGRCRGSCRGAFRGEALPPGSPAPRFTPLALPLVFSGFEPGHLRVGARRLRRRWASLP